MKQFSIRDLMLFVLFVALALAWWIDRRKIVTVPQRFQIVASGSETFVLDTVTGQVWERRGATEFFNRKDGVQDSSPSGSKL